MRTFLFKFLLGLSLLTYGLLAHAPGAVAQTVRCRTVDRKGTGIPGVEVKAVNVGPHRSDDFGDVPAFELSKEYLPGTKIEFAVLKKDMELVDESELFSFVPRDKNEKLKIRLANKGEKQAEIERLIASSTREIKKEFEQQMQGLKAQLQQKQGNEPATQELQKQVAKLTQERDQALKQAQEIAGQLYKVDLTAVSTTYKQAYELFTQGKVLQAQQVIQKADLQKQLSRAREEEKQLKIRLEELAKAEKQIARTSFLQAQMFVTQLQFDSAAAAYEFAIEADPADFTFTFEAAVFFHNQNEPTKALHYYNKLLSFNLGLPRTSGGMEKSSFDHPNHQV
jgi:tetratricopeptide (TPR) repeat protein